MREVLANCQHRPQQHQHSSGNNQSWQLPQRESDPKSSTVRFNFISPGSFAVISGEIDTEPNATTTVQLPKRLIKRYREHSFAIIADSSENVARTSVPNGRVSPFRGRGFRTGTSGTDSDSNSFSVSRSRIPKLIGSSVKKSLSTNDIAGTAATAAATATGNRSILKKQRLAPVAVAAESQIPIAKSSGGLRPVSIAPVTGTKVPKAISVNKFKRKQDTFENYRRHDIHVAPKSILAKNNTTKLPSIVVKPSQLVDEHRGQQQQQQRRQPVLQPPKERVEPAATVTNTTNVIGSTMPLDKDLIAIVPNVTGVVTTPVEIQVMEAVAAAVPEPVSDTAVIELANSSQPITILVQKVDDDDDDDDDVDGIEDMTAGDNVTNVLVTKSDSGAVADGRDDAGGDSRRDIDDNIVAMFSVKEEAATTTAAVVEEKEAVIEMETVDVTPAIANVDAVVRVEQKQRTRSNEHLGTSNDLAKYAKHNDVVMTEPVVTAAADAAAGDDQMVSDRKRLRPQLKQVWNRMNRVFRRRVPSSKTTGGGGDGGGTKSNFKTWKLRRQAKKSSMEADTVPEKRPFWSKLFFMRRNRVADSVPVIITPDSSFPIDSNGSTANITSPKREPVSLAAAPEEAAVAAAATATTPIRAQRTKLNNCLRCVFCMKWPARRHRPNRTKKQNLRASKARNTNCCGLFRARPKRNDDFSTSSIRSQSRSSTLSTTGRQLKTPGLTAKRNSSSKKSQSPTLSKEDKRPLIDMTFVEHNSDMHAAIPLLPQCLAWLCLIANMFVPGSGTIIAGILCLLIGKPRFRQQDTIRDRLKSFVINTMVGLAQFFTIIFCFVGWGWSIWWGVIMLKLARKQHKLNLIRNNEEEKSLPFTASSFSDVERVA